MTDRDRRFVDEYMIDCDAKNAAIRAGYSVKTAKNASAWVRLPNPAKPRVREMIDRRLAEISRRAGVSTERILRELGKIAFADATDIIDPETGRLLDAAERSDTAAVAGMRIKHGRGGTEYEVKFCDKVRALELLGKQLGMFEGGKAADEGMQVTLTGETEEYAE